MQKLSSFGRGKKIRPKWSLTIFLHAALQFIEFITCERNETLNEMMCTAGIQMK